MATYGIPGQSYGGVPGGFNIEMASPKSPWNTSYTYTTPGYANYNAANANTTGTLAYSAAKNAAQSNLAATPYNVQLADIINATNRAAQQASNAGRLGPQGQQIQSNLLGNLEKQSAGLLDPQTEAMMRGSIAQGGQASGMGVDSANLAAAYRRALGQTIEKTQGQAQQGYLGLLAANPGAPIYNMGETIMSPATYGSIANAEASRNLQAQLAQQELAYKYAALNSGGGGGGRGGGGGGYVPSAAQYNSIPAGTSFGGSGGGSFDAPAVAESNPFAPAQYESPFYTPLTYDSPISSGDWSFANSMTPPQNNFGLPSTDWTSPSFGGLDYGAYLGQGSDSLFSPYETSLNY